MHRTIGIIGGLTPESTITYYQRITRRYTERFGDYSYPPIIIHSVSFQQYVDWPNEGRWDLVAEGLANAARSLEAAGASFLLIATNTMHIVQDDVRAATNLPLLSMLDVTAKAISAAGCVRVALLGTRFTMEHGFYQQALGAAGIETLVPDKPDRDEINRVIYEELARGDLKDGSRERFKAIIAELAASGAHGVILGCTEIPLLITPRDVALPVFNTTLLHADAALEMAIS